MTSWWVVGAVELVRRRRPALRGSAGIGPRPAAARFSSRVKATPPESQSKLRTLLFPPPSGSCPAASGAPDGVFFGPALFASDAVLRGCGGVVRLGGCAWSPDGIGTQPQPPQPSPSDPSSAPTRRYSKLIFDATRPSPSMVAVTTASLATEHSLRAWRSTSTPVMSIGSPSMLAASLQPWTPGMS